MTKEIIKLDNISVTFEQKKKQIKAVKDVTLHVNQGDIYGVVGYSGAGKSTLVRVINLLQQPSSGRVEVSGDVLYDKQHQIIAAKKLREKRRKIGMIFQHFNLLNEQTIIQNIAFALKHSGLKEKEITEKAQRLLDLVGLGERKNAFPTQLSGGQQQRVAIARALANDPEILISDEGTSALDPKNTAQILDLLQDLNKKFGLTVVLITHEMDAVKRIANKVAVMDNGEIIERGDLLQIFTGAKERLTRELIGGSAKAIATLRDFKLAKLKADERIVQLTYVGNAVSEPLLVKLYRDFDVEANIIYSNIEVLRGTPVGTLFVIIKGTTAGQQKALDYLQNQGVIITQIAEQSLAEGGTVK
ncbi:MAG: methionine ABC transporter ATP-binding protein [Liquorilactobacillus nagelii]|jgi:D-methionine transport system ATP-binding protein|uniref:Methionine ABC transporter ATP-binding protein n=1 Tax=Liquorilactobacillus nagelii TaxID=82688 RepID=A0A3Q8CLT7_9LACO|nr:methionine ABC transporter ATP-binding protein [Liquorilactobacillus nagelii]AUJ31739.1 methionine ABC transporter ATP-binding protein [Liquorilactobacillus nagelii]KRL41332.1 ABC transporter, ATP-binding protein [Liquorilactobacillus nagelii DSM 13675]MCC7615889.1 methionine ABC transporter ATP-binding protein [Liquorilactobacillus nagelii]MCI1633047.1 methionine ABC transporter ATP-binding protein [Liquorilactobacillus nagelii]MCI1921252.1 methionine ABC transporter ATP-binding protein [L